MPNTHYWQRIADAPALVHVIAHVPVKSRAAGLPAPAGRGPRASLNDEAEFDDVLERPDPSPSFIPAGAEIAPNTLEGAAPSAELARPSVRIIIFVCTGNTCRSPLAEALCKKRLADHLSCAVEDLPARGFVVLSAGLAAMIGSQAAPEAVETARGFGADLTAHASRPVTADLIAQADRIFTMTDGHLQILTSLFPEAAEAARLLAPEGEDIADPVGCELEVYQDCARRIWACLDVLLAELVAGG
jgi:protein-tyrosine phosphatase